jgi:hypothetical protein
VVRIATGDRGYALREQVFERMIGLGGLSCAEQAASHAGNQSIAPFGSFQQHRSAIGGAFRWSNSSATGLLKNSENNKRSVVFPMFATSRM